jgi:hypothetical protein
MNHPGRSVRTGVIDETSVTRFENSQCPNLSGFNLTQVESSSGDWLVQFRNFWPMPCSSMG